MVAGRVGVDEALAVHGHVAQLVIFSVFLPGHGDVVDAPVLRGVGLFRGADPEGDGPPGAGLEGLDGLAALEVHGLAAPGIRAHDAHAQGHHVPVLEPMERLGLPVQHQQRQHRAQGQDPDGSAFHKHSPRFL